MLLRVVYPDGESIRSTALAVSNPVSLQGKTGKYGILPGRGRKHPPQSAKSAPWRVFFVPPCAEVDASGGVAPRQPPAAFGV